MSFTEAEREREKAETEEQANQERKQNIQYALIAMGILSFIVVFFLLSRSIVVTEKWISFFLANAMKTIEELKDRSNQIQDTN
jgi:hypothetical protein